MTATATDTSATQIARSESTSRREIPMQTIHVLTGLFLAPGVPAEVDRTVEMAMDEMRFAPADLTFAPSETVRFVITNIGEMVHEFSIGTDAMHDAHAGEMRRMLERGMMTARDVDEARMHEAGMAHDDANSVLLEPGETAELIWTFPGDADLELACNVPGHRAGGMTGEIEISDRSA